MWVIENRHYLGQVTSWSRAEQFGDGVFETLLITDGVAHALAWHAKRLGHGLLRLNILPPAANLERMLGAYIDEMMEHSGLKDGVVKVMVSRGKSARGYGYDAQTEPCVTVFFSPYIPPKDALYEHGIEVQVCATQCSIQQQLAGLKHINRLENVLAKSELRGDCFEGLMGNYLGLLIEGTMSNVFFEKEAALYTPDLSLSGVEGVMRSLIMEYCRGKGIALHVTHIKMDALTQFASAFVCNSVMGVLPINTLADHPMAIGSITRQLQMAIRSGDIYA
ncbi:MAG: aminodeoxychorismate lyase [Bermanella sp.]